MMCKRPIFSFLSAATSPSRASSSYPVHICSSFASPGAAVPSFQLGHWRYNRNFFVASHHHRCRRHRSIISPRDPPFLSTDVDGWSSQQRQLGSKTAIYSIQNGNDIDDQTSILQDDCQSSNNFHSPSDDIIESTSLAWITKVVIGYNLCPFAERPLREKKLKISVVRGNDDHTVAAAVAYELLARSEESQHGTTSVVVAPEYYPNDFTAYLSLIQFLEEGVMEDHNLHGVLQIAPFHPQFEFEGSGSDGMDNYTNRSPYPMFHILREDDVSKAVDKMGGDASKVWRRNITLMQTMEERFGREGAVRAMTGKESMDGMDGLLRELMLSGYSEEES